MRNKRVYILIVLLFIMTACKEKNTYVELDTTLGNIIVKLYDETPKHKQNFIKLVEDGYYDGVLFHRVIDEFMIQTGDPNTKENSGIEPYQYGQGGPDYKIDAEFNDSLYHKRGALAAARNNNPQKASSGSQFYIVDGKKVTENELELIEKKNNIHFTPEQKEYYKSIGGTPFLDQQYTVFGEVVRGMDVVDSISNVRTGQNNRPVENIRIIRAKLIKFKE